MKQLEKALEALNVEISNYVVKQDDGTFMVYIVGGVEVVNFYDVKDFAKVNPKWEKIDIKAIGDNKEILLPFMYIDQVISIIHLEKLLEMKSLKTLSKEQASNYEVVTKDRLLNKLVYIHESNPSTNSIALAKQFQLEHRNVMQQILKLAETNPSILMGIKYGVYSYESSIPNKKKSDNTESPRGAECSAPHTTNRQLTYSPFLHISEDVYYRFINAMGKPKSKPMIVYRDIKRQEYLKGFQILRERVLTNNVSEKELEELLLIRTEQTKELIVAIKDYVEHYNENSGANKQLNLDMVSRLIFNVINDVLGIDAKSFKYSSMNRDVPNVDKQGALISIESKITTGLRLGKITKITIAEILNIAIGMCVNDVYKTLDDKEVSELISQLRIQA